MKNLSVFLLLLISVMVHSQNRNITVIKETFFNAKYNDVYSDNKYAYLVTDSKFMIFDISIKTNPELLSQIDLNYDLNSMNISGNYAFVQAGKNGVKIIDIFNKKAPQIIAGISDIDSAMASVKVNNYLFIADFGKGILVYDISNIYSPVYISSFLNGKLVTDIDKRGNGMVYITVAQEGVFAYDISDINNIRVRSSHTSAGLYLALKIKNNYAFVADYQNGLKIFNITDTSIISLVSTKNESIGANKISYSNNRLVVSKRNYSGNNKSLLFYKNLLKANVVDGIDVWDITSPSNSIYLKTIIAQKSNSVFLNSADLLIASDNSFTGYDISSVTTPVLNSSIESLGAINDIKKEGSTIILATSKKGLVFINSSDIRNPKILNSYDVWGGVNSFVKKDSIIYAISDSGVKIINVKNILIPKTLGGYNFLGQGYVPKRIAVSGDSIAFVVGGDLPGLSVINIKNPATITEIQRVGFGPLPYASYTDVFSKDTIVFSTNNYMGFFIHSIKPDKNIRLISSIGQGGFSGLTYNNYVYIASGAAGINRYDVNNLHVPQFVENIQTMGDAQAVLIDNNRAFVSNGSEGIDVTDISIPLNPERLARYKTHGNVSRLAVGDSIIYTAENSQFGIYKIEVLAPSITLLSPNGGESWARGSAHNINWLSNRITGSVTIVISYDNGQNYRDTLAAYLSNSGNYQWNISSSSPISMNCKIKIISDFNTAFFDESKEAFSITPFSNVTELNQLSYTLNRNYPNPFNPTTRIEYSVPKNSNVKIEVFDILGNRIKLLVDEVKYPGKYYVDFSAINLSTGIYFYRMTTNEFTKTLKMNYIK